VSAWRFALTVAGVPLLDSAWFVWRPRAKKKLWRGMSATSLRCCEPWTRAWSRSQRLPVRAKTVMRGTILKPGRGRRANSWRPVQNFIAAFGVAATVALRVPIAGPHPRALVVDRQLQGAVLDLKRCRTPMKSVMVTMLTMHAVDVLLRGYA